MAENVRDRNRRTVVGLFTGEEFRIRRIKASEFMQHLGALPIETTPTLADQLRTIGDKLREASNNAESAADLTRFYLERGVTKPKIFFGDYDACPDDQIHVTDLSDDADRLVGAIAEFSFDFSEFKKKMEQVLQRDDPDAAGHGGQEVREAAVGTPANGNGQ